MYRLMIPLLLLAAGAASPVPFGPPQTAAPTRIEQNDPAVTYTGDWYTNRATPNSGGEAALTNLAGARASLTFNGTGITWIGVTDPWSGFARLYLDGTLYNIDTYSSDTRYQQPIFSVRGLGAGSHTLSIEVTHSRDGNAAGSWVWIDAFDIEDGSVVTGGSVAGAGRSEQNSAAVVYAGTWLPNTHAMHSGGSAVLAVDRGSTATFTFAGTGISWLAYRDEWSGIARVYLDGNLAATVDTFLSPAQARSPAYTASGLAAGVHTLYIEVTGTHSISSAGSWVWIDAFDVDAPPSGGGGATASAAPSKPAAPPRSEDRSPLPRRDR
jgi:hypothetical protein